MSRGAGATPRRVLHYASLINRHDFIDHVVRFADPARYELVAVTWTAEGNIEAPRYDRDGISHWILPVGGRGSWPGAARSLAALLRREGVDLLHTHHYREALIGSLASRLAGVPHVIGRHYHDELHVSLKGLRRRTRLLAEGVANRLAAAIVVPSSPIEELLLDVQGVPAGRVHVIPYGFDFRDELYRVLAPGEVEGLRRSLGLDGRFVVGNVSRHHRLKGQDSLVRGFAGLLAEDPEARLLLVGEGGETPALKELAASLGISHSVVFAGWRTDAKALTQVADVIVHPSLMDTLPQVMFEAMIFARPLVITPVAGARDHIRDGETGFLVPMNAPEAVRDVLLRLRAHPEEARRVAETGRRYVLDTLDARDVAARHMDLYDAVLEGRG